MIPFRKRAAAHVSPSSDLEESKRRVEMTIRYAMGECSLGSVLVAATDAGVCAVFLGDDPGALARELRERFPSAEIVLADRPLQKIVAVVARLVEQPGRACNLSLDIRGTAFQKRVWAALRCISAGITASYADIARAIGMPTAPRAVARACGANPLAVLIPCHRVVRADGTLSGYRWGAGRKKALLGREQLMRLDRGNI